MRIVNEVRKGSETFKIKWCVSLFTFYTVIHRVSCNLYSKTYFEIGQCSEYFVQKKRKKVVHRQKSGKSWSFLLEKHAHFVFHKKYI